MFARSTIVNLRRRQCIVKRRSIVLPSVKRAPLLARCYLGEAFFLYACPGNCARCAIPIPFGIFPSTSDRTIEMNRNLHSKQCYQRSVCQTEENCFLPSSLKWLSKHLSISRQLGRKETAKSVRGKIFQLLPSFSPSYLTRALFILLPVPYTAFFDPRDNSKDGI